MRLNIKKVLLPQKFQAAAAGSPGCSRDGGADGGKGPVNVSACDGELQMSKTTACTIYQAAQQRREESVTPLQQRRGSWPRLGFPHTLHKDGEHSPGIPGGVFRYFPLKC